MSIEIYPSDFSTRYELTHAVSISMTAYYNDIGKLTVVAPVNDYNINMLKVGSLLYDTEKNLTYWIVNVKYDTDDNRITANGYSANWMVNHRTILSEYHLTTIESGAYAIISANLRNLPRFALAAATGLTEATDIKLFGGQILDELLPIFEESGLGNKCIWNPSTLQHTFKVYKGNDLTTGIHAVVFSDEMGTAQELVINDDNSTMKNCAYLLGFLGNDEPYLGFIGDDTATDRRELWVETNIKHEDDETDEEFVNRVKEAGKVELAQWIRRTSFSVVVDAADYGSQFNLGDIVSCVSIRFGISFNARITGVKYQIDSNSTDVSIILGEPILTALGEFKLYG